MEIRCDAVIPFPRDLVYRTYRDRLPEMLPYLPNVKTIEVESRKEEGDHVHLVNIWKGGGDLPKAVQAVLSESALSWTDHADWYGDKWECHWRVEPHTFREAVSSEGTNFYTEVEGGTRLEIRGEMTLDAKKIRGVPRLLAGKVGRLAEEFIVKAVQKNLEDVSKSLTRFLEDESKKG
ncbi:MAG: hypothetical protein P1V51_09040 [Deltaproteobacteria bacterium]|nr:hypothetical protein [Deltaproteobacteria bacterium]